MPLKRGTSQSPEATISRPTSAYRPSSGSLNPRVPSWKNNTNAASAITPSFFTDGMVQTNFPGCNGKVAVLRSPAVKVLVTGGAGFIGSHVAEALLKRGDAVTVVDDFNDFYDPALKRRNVTGFPKVIEADIRGPLPAEPFDAI